MTVLLKPRYTTMRAEMGLASIAVFDTFTQDFLRPFCGRDKDRVWTGTQAQADAAARTLNLAYEAGLKSPRGDSNG